MKKLLLGVLSLLCFPILSFAQDVIIKKNADEVQAKVLEIGESTVTYKKFSNPNGPSYTIPKSDIFMIKYQNGDKEVFKEEAPQITQVQLEPQVDTYEQERLERIEQQRLIKEKAELKRRKLMGKHNIKVTFGGGLGATPFNYHSSYSEDEYTADAMTGGSIDFNVVYNMSIADYTGDWGIGLGITSLRGSTDLNDIDWIAVNYLNIPLELTWRGYRGYFGININQAVAVSTKGTYKGETVVDEVDDTNLNKYRLGLGFRTGFSIRKFDIGLHYTWWATNMWNDENMTKNLKGVWLYTPSHEFGVSIAYRIKIM